MTTTTSPLSPPEPATVTTYTIRQDGYDAGEVEVPRGADGDHDEGAVRAAVVALVLDDPSDWATARHATQRVHLCVVYHGEGNADADLALDVVVEVPPTEPECAEGHEHDYVSPHGLFGGLKENPGVVGHGGGVIVSEACRHCGAVKVTDTWATDPYDGTQGHTVVSYYGDETHRRDDASAYFRELGERRAERLDLADREADLSDKGALYRAGFSDALVDRLREAAQARARAGYPDECSCRVAIDDQGIARWEYPSATE